MYRVVIVEDEPEQARILQSMIEKFPRIGELDIEQVSGVPALESLLSRNASIDILMMDIELGSEDANGIDAVKRYFPAGCGTQVIYVTGYIEHCTSVYRTEHVYFLTKPVAQDDLDDALSRALAKLDASAVRPLSVRFGGRMMLVQPHRIDYIESDRRKARIHMGAQEVEIYAALSDLAEELPASFFQCHKSFLVNMDRIVELRKDGVLLSSGQVVPVSQKKRKLMREAFFAHMQAKL